MLTIAHLPLVVAALLTLVAGVTDLWRFKVYNALTLPSLALGLGTALAVGGWAGLGSSLLGTGLGFGLLLVLHALGGVGAGDVKLLTALGAWLGPDWLGRVFVASALFTGLYALGLVLWQRGTLGVAAEFLLIRQTLTQPRTLRDAPRPDLAAEVARPDRRRRLVPFAAMTCLGFWATLLGTQMDHPPLATPLGAAARCLKPAPGVLLVRLTPATELSPGDLETLP